MINLELFVFLFVLWSVLDINECDGDHGCHVNAQCINLDGGYQCECLAGFTGDGRDCSSKHINYVIRKLTDRSH